ncbi:MAG: hypothetical protein MUP02_02020 [Actinobacteria bacterium]|nr:hypothetical protein [Actinomycetota bacterium]
MLENLFFILGIVNNLFLIIIFLVRNKMAVLKRIGWIYFLLAIPAAYGIFLVIKENKAVQYAIFLGIFLAFLAIEGLYDYILKIDFRTNFKKNWKLLIPYLILYYAMSYGFIVMVWKTSLIGGAVMFALVIIQILINIITHPRKRKEQ